MPSILIVDDSAVSRRLLRHTLRRHDYHVLEAANGREALRLLTLFQVDLLIVDLVMPEMDGLTLLRQLADVARLEHLRLIVLTASGQAQARLNSQEAGVHSFLTKPTSSRELIDTVESLLAHSACAGATT